MNITLRGGAVAALVLFLSGCSGPSSPVSPAMPTIPTPTVPTPPIGPENGANWIGDAAVVSFTGEGCGSMTAAGRTGVLWKIAQTGGSVTLDEDMHNWPTDDSPYTGSLNGTQFTATYVQPQGPGSTGCLFVGGDLIGSFSDDGLRFDAVETIVWRVADQTVRLVRRWTGRRL